MLGLNFGLWLNTRRGLVGQTSAKHVARKPLMLSYYNNATELYSLLLIPWSWRCPFPDPPAGCSIGIICPTFESYVFPLLRISLELPFMVITIWKESNASMQLEVNPPGTLMQSMVGIRAARGSDILIFHQAVRGRP